MAKEKEEVAHASATVADLAKSLSKIYPGSIKAGSEVFAVRRVPIRKVPIIDFIIGGGVPINRVIELVGPPSSGKSYLSLLIIVAFQNTNWGPEFMPYAFKSIPSKPQTLRIDKDTSTTIHIPGKPVFRDGIKLKAPVVKRAVYVDYEGTYDKDWAEKLGVDNFLLIHVVPAKGSEAIDITEAYLRNPEVCLVVFDSVGATASDLETDASMENEQMGVNARFWNKAMRKFQAAMNSNPEQDVTLVLLNRQYQGIGMYTGKSNFGGSGITFGKSISVELRPLREMTAKDAAGVANVVGRNIVAECAKNKTARPHLTGTFYFSFVDDDKAGIMAGETDVLGQIVDLGLRCGVIVRSGAYYSYGRHKIQGMESFKDAIITKNLVDKLREDVFKLAFATDKTVTAIEEGDAEE